MYKQKFIILFLIFSYLLAWGKNATTMEYRSAKTAARSERDLPRAETLALKALDMKEHANDGKVAYFLATEIYKPYKKWEKMNTMLDIALLRNDAYKKINGKDQRLEKPLRLDDGTVVNTIPDAVKIYRETVWMMLFNDTVNLIEAEKFEEALKKINYAKLVLDKVDNYITGCLLYEKIDDIENAKKELNSALQLDSDNLQVLELAGDFAQNDSDFTNALSYYKKAEALSESNSNLIEKIIAINIALERYDDAILLSEKQLDKNPDDADTYYNVGIIYQRLASNLYSSTIDDWKEITNQNPPLSSDIKANYNNFKQALNYADNASGYFMDSILLEEEENLETGRAINDMKRLRNSIKKIYLDSIREIAKNNNVDLN